MKTLALPLLALLAFVICSCAPAVVPPAPTPTQRPDTPTVASAASAATAQAFASMNTVKIEAPSLAQNLVGEPPERTISVYLPPSYGSSEKHYPVIYYLPGYGDTRMMGFHLPGDMDSVLESGKVEEMIVVVAGGDSILGGSFYVNSPVTGNWEDFIAEDLVSYVDNHFRTLPQAESRGIAGHSMGGFGALNIAMHRPDVFRAVYSLSPGLFDENGLAESFMFADERMIQDFVDFEKELAALPLAAALKKKFVEPYHEFSLAYGYAFAPNPDRHPPYFDYPYIEVDGQLVRDEDIWKKWAGGFGGIAEETVQYKENLLQLKGIAVDYGFNDENPWIPKGAEYYGEQLTSAGIPVSVEGYNGNHFNRLSERIGEHMLPFFSDLLAFE